MLREFKEFAMRGNVMDMAVGIILGAAFGAVVNSLVKDVIMPPIGAATGGVDFSNIVIPLRAGPPPVVISIGLFVNALIAFLVVAFAVFLLVKAVNRVRRQEPPPPTPPTRQEELLAEIRDLLRARPTM